MRIIPNLIFNVTAQFCEETTDFTDLLIKIEDEKAPFSVLNLLISQSVVFLSLEWIVTFLMRIGMTWIVKDLCKIWNSFFGLDPSF